MHLTDDELAAVAAQDASVRLEWRSHVSSCAVCAEQVESMMRDSAEVEALLGELDHRPPQTSARQVIATAQRRRWVAARRIAAGLALCAAAAAAAMPSSPIHRAIVRALGTAPESPAAVARSRSSLPDDALGAGISIVPGPAVEIRFRDWQTAGRVTITVTDATQLSLVPRGGGAAFLVSRGHVTVDNAGSVANYALQVPRSAAHVVVAVDTSVLVRIDTGRIAGHMACDSSGACVTELVRPPSASSPRQ